MVALSVCFSGKSRNWHVGLSQISLIRLRVPKYHSTFQYRLTQIVIQVETL